MSSIAVQICYDAFGGKMVTSKFIEENSGLLHKLRLLKDEKQVIEKLSYIQVDLSSNSIELGSICNGNRITVKPNNIYRHEPEGFNIDLTLLQAKLIEFTKDFIIKDAELRIEMVETKLKDNGIEI